MTEQAPLRVSVVCAWPDRTWQRELALAAGSTVADALAASGWREQLLDTGLLAGEPRFGIYGRPATAAEVLHEGDRVEIYRPLLADPQTIRRQRAAGGR
jgi:putative ubiquitin-RnfH superfamily antitoxin RatB of RatAB toxin-antitoxin module